VEVSLNHFDSLGWESRAPTWAVTRFVNHCLSIPIGRSRIDPGRTKLVPAPSPETLELIHSSSRRAATHAVTALPRAL
jgi:hypothetical protein